MKFSVIIPAYNAGKFIEEGLFSVRGQTFFDYEVIVVNDGSTDSTRATVLNYIDKHKEVRIKLIDQENKGLGAARNTGIRQAQGEFIALLDADDIWYKDKLEKVHRALIDAPETDVICHGELWFDKITNKKRAIYYGPSKDCTYKELLFKGNRLSSSASVIRKKAIEKVGLFSENRNWHGVEDYDMWLKLAEANVRFLFLNDICGEYILHGSNMTQDIVLFNSRVLNVIEYHFSRLPGNSLFYAHLFNRRKAAIYQDAAIYFIKAGKFYLAWKQMLKSLNI